MKLNIYELQERVFHLLFFLCNKMTYEQTGVAMGGDHHHPWTQKQRARLCVADLLEPYLYAFVN